MSKEEAAVAEEQKKNESAFLLAWLGLGGVILVQGIVLSASGMFRNPYCCSFCGLVQVLFAEVILIILV